VRVIIVLMTQSVTSKFPR